MSHLYPSPFPQIKITKVYRYGYRYKIRGLLLFEHSIYNNSSSKRIIITTLPLRFSNSLDCLCSWFFFFFFSQCFRLRDESSVRDTTSPYRLQSEDPGPSKTNTQRLLNFSQVPRSHLVTINDPRVAHMSCITCSRSPLFIFRLISWKMDRQILYLLHIYTNLYFLVPTSRLINVSMIPTVHTVDDSFTLFHSIKVESLRTNKNTYREKEGQILRTK